MRKTIIILIFLFILFPWSKAKASDFTTSYKITYDVNDKGEAEVSSDISIKNISSRIYATEYTLTVSHIKIYDIKASDSKGELKTEITTKDEKTNIKVYFGSQVIGEGKSLQWNLKYKTKYISGKVGQVLEINIPKISTLSNVEMYEVTLIVPKEFGPLMYITPSPTESWEKDNKHFYKFGLDQIQKSSITASFGDYQLFNFELKFHIQNNGILPARIPVAFPPDIPERQQIIIDSVSPKPDLLEIDKDSNYIAYYTVPPNTDYSIDLIGKAVIINKVLKTESGGEFSKIPKNYLNLYTKELKYWETGNPKIKGISKTLKDPSKTVSENAFRAYEYVTKTLKYKDIKDGSVTVQRLGALKALENPSEAICMEFVDLFITISRNMGIPAREINGFAYSKNAESEPLSINLRGGDVLHSWAEYFDPNFGWVPIDPTWGSTSNLDYFSKLDTNHLAFVIKGLSSEYPLPAGSYKLSSDDKPQVDVSFAYENIDFKKVEYKLKAYFSKNLNPLILLTGKKQIVLKNGGNISVFNLDGKGTVLPPFGKTKALMSVSNGSVLVSFEDFDGNKKELKIKVEKDQEPGKLSPTIFSLVVIISLALLLYVIFYYFVARKVLQKKPAHRPPHRPRAQDQ